MKAAVCVAHGPVASVALQEVAPPSMRPGAVRIRIAVAAVNPPDALMPQGKYQVRPELPFTLGLEGAGIVTEVAEDVDTLAVGDRVMTYAGQGCFAQEAVVPAHLVYRVPDDMPMEQAAGFTVVYGTAYHALHDRGQLRAGQTVAILGAAGGLGLCAIQIARAIGARVIAVASSQEKLAVCKAHGAHAIALSGRADLKDHLRSLGAGGGIDLVHDTVGGPLTVTALRALRPHGTHLIVGYASGEVPLIPANYVLLKQVSVVGVSFRQCAQDNPRVARAGIDALTRMWAQGLLEPPVARIHAFEDFHKAVAALSCPGTTGKHLIRVADI